MKYKLKIQNQKFKINSKLKIKNNKVIIFEILVSFVICALLSVISPLYAKEITIIYTGETHAMLYPCNCPIEPDGGISRRASLIKELREKNPDILVLDSGGFFGGGIMDGYTQNTELDSQRTIINLKAMEVMGYDVVNIGDDEFNFGRDFLQDKVDNTKITFVSANLVSDKILPFIIKDVQGVKFGITGICGRFVISKSGGIKFIDPKAALEKIVRELREKGADIIVLLSHLGESDDIDLIKEVEGIDILVTGHMFSKDDVKEKMGATVVVRPAWQGRKLGVLSLTVENNKIINYKIAQERLSDKIKDDKDVQSILPQCFSESNCKKEGALGVCQDAGKLSARCLFTDAAKIKLTVVTSKNCIACNTERVINYLKGGFSSMNTSYLYFPDAEARKLINNLGIKVLPVYLLDKSVENEADFNNIKPNLERKGDFYMVKPQFSGVGYFLGRQVIKGKLDLFISLYGKDMASLLDKIKDYRPAIHFLAINKSGKAFEAANGRIETEEYLRSVCVQKYYPQAFFDYISCRAKNIHSSWWEDCLPTGKADAAKMDINKIKGCAKGAEGAGLLNENIRINKEIEIMIGPAVLMDNQQVFGIEGVPTEQELKDILKK